MTTRHATTIDLPVAGLDCASCAAHIKKAVAAVPGVQHVHVLVSAGRVTIALDPDRVSTDRIKTAIREAGYSVPEPVAHEAPAAHRRDVGQIVGWGTLGLVAVVLVAVLCERLGLFDRAIDRLPWWVPAIAIVVGGWPVFAGVVQAARRLRVTSHTLMTVGVLAAIAIGQWMTAALMVFFMRFAGWLEGRTMERNRQALKNLVALQPMTARVLRGGREVTFPVDATAVGDRVLVHPGERIPVDGRVLMVGHELARTFQRMLE